MIGGQTLPEIRVNDGRLEVKSLEMRMHLVRRGKGLIAGMASTPGEVSAHAVSGSPTPMAPSRRWKRRRAWCWGQHFTLVNYRVLFVWTVYTEIVRRLDRRAVVRVDEVVETSVLRG